MKTSRFSETVIFKALVNWSGGTDSQGYPHSSYRCQLSDHCQFAVDSGQGA